MLSYSKFTLTLFFLGTFGTNLQASELKNTYLKCDDRYYRLNGNYLSTNYNIRTKKFKSHFKITDYKTNYIKTQYGSRIDRNTGEYKSSDGSLICILQVINYNDLPKLDEKGKLF